MIHGNSVLAVIPARGGSKRFPNKNLASFRGRPLITWTILEAQKSKYIDRLILSTDDEDIEICALIQGCKTIRRPVELATDSAKSEDAVRHVMENSHPHDWIVLLQATSPLRTASDIDRCIELARVGEGCVSYRQNNTKNGAVYVATWDLIKRGENFDFPFTSSFIMPDDKSLDVDYPEELIHCDLISSHRSVRY